ncbi:MAG: hypothetical protein ACOC6G_00640 [Thermoproteota archaeon]
MCKKNFLFFAGLLSIFLMFTLYAFMVPVASALEPTVEEKGLTVLGDVVGLDMAEYDVAAVEHPAREDSSLGVPTVDLNYELTGEGSRLEGLSTFADGSLQMMHVLEKEGEPVLTEPVESASDVEMAEAFLGSYLEHTGDPLYGTLQSTLSSVDPGRNATKTFGDKVLEVTAHNGETNFRWYYTSNGAAAKYTKNVVLQFKDGFLKAFVDNWHLYPIGNDNVALSESEAQTMALETAESYNWSLQLDSESRSFNQSNVRWASLLFDDSQGLDEPREDPFVLYPVWRVGVALNQWHGHLYGVVVEVWADTGEIRSIQEAWFTLPPPEGVPTADMSMEASQSSLTGESRLHSALGMPFTALATALTGAALVCTGKTKNVDSYNSPRMRMVKAGGILLCILMLSMSLFAPIQTVSATTRVGVIWGSQSDGALDENGTRWRKHSDEIYWQQNISSTIKGYFDQSGYTGYDYQGPKGSNKSDILGNITCLNENNDVMAVVVFDHGIGNDDYSEDQGHFHFMFEDNNGTVVGEPGQEDVDWWYAPENGVYDMDVYRNLTDHSKVAFAFINTCLSANRTHAGPAGGGLNSNGNAQGMPFAWTNRTVVDRDIGGFNPSLNMSKDGHGDPDDGSQCYIGFPWGSASLMQTIPYDNGTEEYHDWVDRFFEYALLYDMSVNMALDHASLETWQNHWGASPLQDFKAYWWSGEPNATNNPWPDCSMVVYGNGDVCLRYYEPGWTDDFDDDSMDSSKWQKLEANGASVEETGGELAVTVPSGSGQAQAGVCI